MCKQVFKRHQEGTEVVSPYHALASDDVSEPLRTCSDWSRVDRGVDGQDWRQELIALVHAEFDEHSV